MESPEHGGKWKAKTVQQLQLFPSPICRPNDETSSEAFVISGVGFGNTSKVTAVEEAFSNERSWTPKRLLRRIATVLKTKLRSRIKR